MGSRAGSSKARMRVHARTSEFAPNDYLTRLGLHRVVGTPEARDAAVGGDICDHTCRLGLISVVYVGIFQ